MFEKLHATGWWTVLAAAAINFVCLMIALATPYYAWGLKPNSGDEYNFYVSTTNGLCCSRKDFGSAETRLDKCVPWEWAHWDKWNDYIITDSDVSDFADCGGNPYAALKANGNPKLDPPDENSPGYYLAYESLVALSFIIAAIIIVCCFLGATAGGSVSQMMSKVVVWANFILFLLGFIILIYTSGESTVSLKGFSCAGADDCWSLYGPSAVFYCFTVLISFVLMMFVAFPPEYFNCCGCTTWKCVDPQLKV